MHGFQRLLCSAALMLQSSGCRRRSLLSRCSRRLPATSARALPKPQGGYRRENRMAQARPFSSLGGPDAQCPGACRQAGGACRAKASLVHLSPLFLRAPSCGCCAFLAQALRVTALRFAFHSRPFGRAARRCAFRRRPVGRCARVAARFPAPTALVAVFYARPFCGRCAGLVVEQPTL